MKKLICIDLDNTLIDSEEAHVSAYNAALVKNGFKKMNFDKIAKLFGRPHIEVIKILIGSNNRKLIEKIRKDHYDFLIKKYYPRAKPFPGVKVILKMLKKKYKLAILSNTSHNCILALLRGAKINRRLFDLIIGNDDVKRSKPWPDEILKAEKLVHHKADYIIGDSIYDIMAGKMAGVKTISVTSGRYSKKILSPYNPNYIIKEFKDIKNIV